MPQTLDLLGRTRSHAPNRAAAANKRRAEPFSRLTARPGACYRNPNRRNFPLLPAAGPGPDPRAVRNTCSVKPPTNPGRDRWNR